jgi:phospholipid/cholesterol/gamma-HCH transport system substrate-binding protein
LLLVGVAPVTACDVRTATAPGGELTLWASFDEVQDLTRGNFVQINDVVVGSVGSLELDGDRAVARLDLEDRTVPLGTRAVVRRTSLLGEHFVDLVLPEAAGAPALHDGDTIEDTSSQLELEELAGRAEAVLGAVNATSVSGTLAAADEALGRRGQLLNTLIAQTSDVVGAIDAQRDALVGAIDGLTAAAGAFAPEADGLVALIDATDDAARTVAANRDRAVASAQAIVDLLATLDEQVLAPDGELIVQLLAQANPVLGALAARSSAISGLFEDIVFFNTVFPTVQANGQVLIQAWLDPTVLLGGQIDPTDPAGLVTALLNSLL